MGGIAHIITRKKYAGRWPDFRNPDDEVCIACGRVPGQMGCKKIGSRYNFLVDHSPTLPVVLANQQQPECDIQIAIPLRPQYPDEHGQDQGQSATNATVLDVERSTNNGRHSS